MTEKTQEIITRLVNDFYQGDNRKLFDQNGWEWMGNQSMNARATLIKNTYGSIQKFEQYLIETNIGNSRHPLENYSTAYLTSFWGWSPESWGCVSFAYKKTMERYLESTTDPFVMAIYVTKHADAPASQRTKLVGFYELSHETGERFDFVSEEQQKLNPERWPYALKAIRCWEVPESFRPVIYDFDPTVWERVVPIGVYGQEFPPDVFEQLKRLPVKQIDVYGQPPVGKSDVIVPDNPYIPSLGNIQSEAKGWVSGGTYDLSGSFREPQQPEKQLYILQLEGKLQNLFEEKKIGSQKVIKVGLSHDPANRLKAFNKSLPNCSFKWSILRSTNLDGHPHYSHPLIAEAGELAMKQYLGRDLKKYLGGEFYLASDTDIDLAWNTGRKVSLAAEKDMQGLD